MKTRTLIYLTAIIPLTAAIPLQADWRREPASDVDKEFISGNPGLGPNEPAHEDDYSCWLAAAANMLAAAGYGDADTLQARADDIYLDLLGWQASLDETNIDGVSEGGWTDTALDWWLHSTHNLWDGNHAGYDANPYTVITSYGSKSASPLAEPELPAFMGNELREYRPLALGVYWKSTTSLWGESNMGHMLTYWGDSGSEEELTVNPDQLVVADSDTDNGGDLQTYTYDDYGDPIDLIFGAGNGWYFNYGTDHPFITWLVTLGPTDSPVDPDDGPTQRVIGSRRLRQPYPFPATDLHYEAWTDYDILSYRTEIDWPTENDASIHESNAHQPDHLWHTTTTRDTIHVDWDLSDHPIPSGRRVTITTEFILQSWNGIAYDDVHFTYGLGTTSPSAPNFGWYIATAPAVDVNVPDITGGFVIGAFDVYDFLGEPNLVCEYRLIHQYSYTQDPERHIFTLFGGNDRCADFDDLPAQSRYNTGDSFRTRGYTVKCREFFMPDGQAISGQAQVSMASASGGSGSELQIYGINAEFDFGDPVPCISFLYAEYGPNVNIRINNDFRNVKDFADVDGLTVGGCSVTVTDNRGDNEGVILIEGQIERFEVGGQELFIDDVCFSCDDSNRYVATNFRFGHTYGLLDAESLWQFNDWMTHSPHRAVLSQRQPYEIALNWEGELPYPESRLLPTDQIPELVDCTVYLEADLNKDCRVDALDLAILADQWLQSTKP